MKKIINNIEYDLTTQDIAQREQDAIQAEQEITENQQKLDQEKAR
jgi:hypothetical protein